jgi:hypothetical protein
MQESTMKNQAQQFLSIESLEAIVERDLQDALVNASGVDCTWQPDQPLTQDCVTIAEDAQAHISYPWNPANAEVFFSRSDRFSILDDLDAEEVSECSHQFFDQLNSIWATAALQNSLSERFAIQLPQSILSAIVHRARTIATTSVSLADQLVECVQDLMPLNELVTEDLYVLARPYANTMRGDLAADPLVSVRSTEWEQLSETEQVRLSLAVARQALEEIKAEEV